MAGRKRKPTGTVAPKGGRPDPPAYLDPDEVEAFKLLVDQIDGSGLLSAAHVETIALAASRRVEVERLAAEIREHGSTYWTTSTQGDQVLKANPAVRMRSEAARHLHSLLAEFGLTPTSVAKATPPKKAAEENPFLQLAAKRRGRK